MPGMAYDDDDDLSALRLRGRPALTAFVTSLLTTVAAFAALTVADRRGLLDFLRPAKREVEVPSITGVNVDQARDLLQARGLLLTLQGERPDPAISAGKIAAQVPLAGSRAPSGTAIQAFVSSGAGEVAIPKLAGLKPDDAVDQLRELKLSAGHRREEASETVAAGLVIGTDPPAGKNVGPNTAVALIISTGPVAKPVPKVIGLRLSKAKKTLEEAGFKVGKTRYGYSENYDEQVIIKQEPAENTPAENTPAAPGSEVNLVVNE
jgi:eukaryotic-like serine/threonine-protein kinase